jgi:sodium/bile acid cotransporter 7
MLTTYSLFKKKRATFSGAFQTGAIYDLSTSSVLFCIFINVALYLVFTIVCFFASRPPVALVDALNSLLTENPLARRLPSFARRCLTLRRMSKEETIAICFCGPAKTTSLGIPLVTAMWKDADDATRAFIQIPVLLYTIEQVRKVSCCASFVIKKKKGKAKCADASRLLDDQGLSGSAACALLPVVPPPRPQGGVGHRT